MNHLEKIISNRKHQLAEINAFWKRFELLNSESAFTDSTYNDVKAKVSSKINYLERSIRDHMDSLNF